MTQLGDERPVRFLVHDRNATFCLAFDEIFRSEGIRLIRTPIQAPNANAHAERWVRTLRAEYLDRSSSSDGALNQAGRARLRPR
jgi:putative transposase